MTALVTGASGFVGSAVVRALLAEGETVRALVREQSSLVNLQGLPVQRVVGDLSDERSLRLALEACERVFHVAADYRLWVPDPGSMYQTNVEGTRQALRLAREAGVERFVYTSSVATLGNAPDGSPADETMPVERHGMIGHYKRSKYDAEQVALEAAGNSDKGMSVVIVNPSTPLGPGDIKPTPTGRIVLDALQGRLPAYVDTGLNIVHVDDVARGHLLAAEHGVAGRRYILGGEDMSLRRLLSLIAEAAGQRPPRLAIPHGVAMCYARLSEAWAGIRGREPRATVDGVRMSRRKMYFSSARAARELGYTWREPELAVRDAVDWFRRLNEQP